MPPEIPNQQPLAARDAAAEVPRELTAVASFFSLDGVGAALAGTGFTRKEHTEHLINIARTAEKDGDRLKALQMVHKITLDVISVNGQLATVRDTHADPNGNTRTAEARTLSRLLTAAGQAAPFTPAAPALVGITQRAPHTSGGGGAPAPLERRPAAGVGGEPGPGDGAELHAVLPASPAQEQAG